MWFSEVIDKNETSEEARSETLLKLVKPDARNSPVKKENFKLLLES